MAWRQQKRITIGGLLVVVAFAALIVNMLRPPTPPNNEGQAIAVAKAHLIAHNEFGYPLGYWARAAWNSKRGTWRVGFLPARKGGGPSQLIDVSPDRSCRTAPMDFSFFDL